MATYWQQQLLPALVAKRLVTRYLQIRKSTYLTGHTRCKIILQIFYFSCGDMVVKDLYAASLKINTEEQDTRNLSRQLHNLLTEISIKLS